MRNFLANLTSLYWWISVVVVGVIINIASAYLKTTLDTRLSHVSVSWRNKSQARKAKREAEIEILRSDPHMQEMSSFAELRDRVKFFFFIGGYVLVIGADFVLKRLVVTSSWPRVLRILMLFAAAVAALLAFQYHLAAARKATLLTEVTGIDSEENQY